MLYRHEHEDSKEILTQLQFDEFVSNANTSSIFKTGQMVVHDQMFEESELIGNPTRIIETGKKVSKTIFGIAVEFEDMVYKQIQINKVNKLF
jgi:hypothetical protein